MTKKINTKLNKLIKYYSLINYNLIYDNQSINRYKKNKSNISGNKEELLKKLEASIRNIKNCELKNSSTDLVFADGHPDAKIMIVAEAPGAEEDQEGRAPGGGRPRVLLRGVPRQARPHARAPAHPELAPVVVARVAKIRRPRPQRHARHRRVFGIPRAPLRMARDALPQREQAARGRVQGRGPGDGPRRF